MKRERGKENGDEDDEKRTLYLEMGLTGRRRVPA